VAKGPKQPPYKQAGFATQNAYAKARKLSKEWSDKHAHIPGLTIYAGRGIHKNPKVFRAYYNAFVSPTSGLKARRKKGYTNVTRAFRHYVVDVMDWYPPDDFNDVYSRLH
jgi:hypothetical protein